MEKLITSSRLGESYTQIKHSSGLTILLYPMKDFKTSYAVLATKYGSIDTRFRLDKQEDYTQVPDGIAHFLEHKMFESEDGDAFSLYAQTGASANAYTSFDKTAYLFSCSDQFEESLKILLEFVNTPYFTQETVEKEQGIIGQEIQMFDDNADWQLFFQLLQCMYHNHPVRIDIAGTVESIAKIDAPLLHACYNTFYNLNNMVLAVAGGFTKESVLHIADQILKKAPEIQIERDTPHEPVEVKEHYHEISLPVAVPMFSIGFKLPCGAEYATLKQQAMNEMLTELIAGTTTDFYKELYDEGLINTMLDQEVFVAGDCTAWIFSGESRQPKVVYERLCKRIQELKENGFTQEEFSYCKAEIYGRYISIYSRAEAVATTMMQTFFLGEGIYDIIEIVADMEYEALLKQLHSIVDVEHSALSVVMPLQEEK